MKHSKMVTAPFYHRPVLLEEAISSLDIHPGGIYVDATFGGGGHSREILKSLGREGRLIAFDQDEDAGRNLPEDARIEWIPENFRYLEQFLRVKASLPVSGILADLGVSSYQFDTAERGFSIRMEGPLDMRMDRRQKRTAAEIVQQYKETDLLRIFETYGEVRNAKTLAAQLVKERERFPLKTIEELKAVIKPLIRGNERRYLAQVFQALRIEVNDELGALRDFLKQAARALKPGGRLVIITFHSIEDRMVKHFMKKGRFEEIAGNLDVEKEPVLQPVFKKPVLPGKDEVKKNPRAASAKLRVAERI